MKTAFAGWVCIAISFAAARGGHAILGFLFVFAAVLFLLQEEE